MPTLEIIVNDPNATVTVTKKRRGNTGQKTKRDDEPLGRRKKKSGKTKFYDLGQSPTGTTDSWSLVPNLFLEFDGHSYGNYLMADPLTLSQFKNTFLDPLIATNVTTFQSRYREIKKSVGLAYGILIQGIDVHGNPYEKDSTLPVDGWDDNGIEFTEDELNGESLILMDRFFFPLSDQKHGSLFWPIELIDRGATKVTDVYNFGADSVPYQFKNGDIVFIVPTPTLSVGISSTQGVFPISEYVVYKNMIYMFRPRQFTLPNFVYFSSQNTLDYSPTEFAALLGLVDSRSPNRNITERIYGNGSPVDFFVGGTFPASPPSFVRRGLGYDMANRAYVESGWLLAVIKQGNHFYYLWSNPA